MKQKPYTILGGKLVLAERAAIPVGDRGFRFGDGVFETILIKDFVPYQWEFHIDRLMQGLVAARIPSPVGDWTTHAKKLLKKNEVRNGFLRIAVSRGVGSRGYMPHPPGMPATWVMEALSPLAALPAPCKLWLSSSARIPRQCLPMNFKLAQGMGNTLALLEAHDNHCDEALQLTTEGFICEAASANIFWIKNGELYTPPLDTGCLNGSTRDAILRISPIGIRAKRLGLSALEDADAAFLTNCRLGIWPIDELQPSGKEFAVQNPLLRQLTNLLTADKAAYIAKHKKYWAGRR